MSEINKLKITMTEISKDVQFIKESLIDNKTEHKEILTRIDHLGDTFQGKIKDKADQKEVMTKFDAGDEKYASKDIEKWAYGATAGFIIILIGIIGFLLDKMFFK